MEWINERREATGKPHIAIDGKALRSSWKGSVNQALHVVTAYDVDSGLALYKQVVQRVKRDILLCDIIDALAVEGSIVTLDALHCQSTTLETIIKSKNDFIVQVKANQRPLHGQVKEEFAAYYEKIDPSFRTKNSI